MAKIQYIKDKENVTVYPVTHERAVRDSNNVTLETKLGQKQETLVSGTNIKTINNESILGSGNLSIVTDVSGKQDTLVSGTNIKTINNTSLLGSGNISVQETLVSGTNIKTINNESIIGSGNLSVVTDISGKQDTLVSGTNIKTVNGESLLGSGNITAGDPNAVKYTTQSLTSEQKEQARTNINAQESLVSGTTIKTVNNQSILGSGNITAGVNDVTSPQDGTLVITLSNGDVVTVDLNHTHPTYEEKVNKVDAMSSSSTTTQYPSAKCVYDELHPAIQSSQPVGGFLPNIEYDLGTLTGSVTFSLASGTSGIVNHYYWTFDTGGTAPTITWPSGVSWSGGSDPNISENSHYEVSILNGVGVYMEI